MYVYGLSGLSDYFDFVFYDSQLKTALSPYNSGFCLFFFKQIPKNFFPFFFLSENLKVPNSEQTRTLTIESKSPITPAFFR